jgi:hypothetical protein
MLIAGAAAWSGMLPVVARRKRMRQTPTFRPPDVQLERDPLARIAVSAEPAVLEGRYRLTSGPLRSRFWLATAVRR